jgi:hypothetical protein
MQTMTWVVAASGDALRNSLDLLDHFDNLTRTTNNNKNNTNNDGNVIIRQNAYQLRLCQPQTQLCKLLSMCSQAGDPLKVGAGV